MSNAPSQFCSLFFFADKILIISSGREGVLGPDHTLLEGDVSDEELGGAVLGAITGHREFDGDPTVAPPFFEALDLASWHQFDAGVLFECEVEVALDNAIIRPFGPAGDDEGGGREPIPGQELEGLKSPDSIGMNIRIAFFTTAGKRV